MVWIHCIAKILCFLCEVENFSKHPRILKKLLPQLDNRLAFIFLKFQNFYFISSTVLEIRTRKIIRCLLYFIKLKYIAFFWHIAFCIILKWFNRNSEQADMILFLVYSLLTKFGKLLSISLSHLNLNCRYKTIASEESSSSKLSTCMLKFHFNRNYHSYN